MTPLKTWELRAEFAKRLSTMYGNEVPAYNELVEVSTAVNEDYVAKNGTKAERFGSISRVTAERHGAIRVGSPKEMSQVARVFAAFGMFPVGFYDLRDASSSSVPVVATAFRPIDEEELAKNPFRVFTSMLAAEDPRFFDSELQAELAEFIGARELFSTELLELADQSLALDELPREMADRLLDLATASLELSGDPVDYEWYKKLESISAVAADIGGISSTHINHLTPRVLDIDELYNRMQERGICMIDEIQGPPRWDGPDVLLRQTSFRALGENRVFRYADGTTNEGELRVRFGEVEARGIALTTEGRDLYDRMVAEADSRLANSKEASTRASVAAEVWAEELPGTEKELAVRGLAFFTFSVDKSVLANTTIAQTVSLTELITAGIAIPHPIVYEDFLPRSAAGIFQSNLTEEGSKDEAQLGTSYDINRMSQIIGTEVHDPNNLYQRQQDDSVAKMAKYINASITR